MEQIHLINLMLANERNLANEEDRNQLLDTAGLSQPGISKQQKASRPPSLRGEESDYLGYVAQSNSQRIGLYS